MISAQEALQRLRKGNQEFAEGKIKAERFENMVGLATAAADRAQEPFAVILGCSDSRVPVELLFNQGFGDLFVIRVAGNIVAPSQIGSIEFAAEKFGTPLVVVLGHTRCGAVTTTLEVLQKDEQPSRNLRSIVDRIRPSVQGLLNTDLKHKPDQLIRAATRTNVSMVANFLRHGSQSLEQLIGSDGLLVVGAEYSVETGRVEFFDGVPESFL